MEEPILGPQPHRRMVVSSLWMQAVILTFIVGFTILTYLAIKLYQDHPPVPGKIVTPDGQVVLTKADIMAGQEAFLTYGLMEYGSIYGHGAYLGPDFTASYLHREAELMIAARGGGPAAAATVLKDLRTNRYSPQTDTLVWTPDQSAALETIQEEYATQILQRPRSGAGLGPNAIPSAETVHQITGFIAWTAWTSAATRPGQPYSYTNNWPAEPLAGNHVTQEAVVWSVLSIVALLGGTGLLLAFFGRYSGLLGWHGTEEKRLRFVPAADVALTPGQKTVAWYFLIVAVLFLIQTLLGGATAHYHAESGGFFGMDLAMLLPYNLTRTWHLQLSIFFVATAYLAAGIFKAPLVSRREPRGQAALSYVLLGALVIVVFGSLAGEAASYKGFLGGALRPFIGAQGWEYLDLGRLWQILLVLGMVLWCAILYRGLRRRLAGESWGNLPYLFFFSALTIPAFYAVGLVNSSSTNFAIADFWRFWVVHLWVEDFLELFTTILVAFIFVLLGVVSERTATRVVYLDILLYSLGGVVGTMHHLYFSGTPAIHMALGAFFSAGEVIPLTFLTVEAWAFLQLGARQETNAHAPFPHRWAVLFLASVGFWNFLGAGVFGFLVNLPVVSYYEIGTQLTANHAHASMMGVYGMLAVALLVFCLRYLLRPEDWNDRWIGFSFWSLNLGLAWMIFANLFPIGILQLGDSVQNGYFHARSLEFFHRYSFIEWLRLPGDVIFILGVLPLVYYTIKALVRPKAGGATRTPDGHAAETSLFMELTPGAD